MQNQGSSPPPSPQHQQQQHWASSFFSLSSPSSSSSTTTTPNLTFPTPTTLINHLRDPKPKPILLYTFLPISLLSLLFFLFSFSFSNPHHLHSGPDPFLYPTHHHIYRSSSTPPPPSIAYLISGSRGDSSRLTRLLLASYHPLNHYLLHLDATAPISDREGLARVLHSHPVFNAARNVHVMGKPDFAYPKGSSPVSMTLHGASILLRLNVKWDWFVSLTADSYPLVTQDDLLHILSFLPKDMNFVNHSSYIGWKESRKLKPIIVDPGLYLSEGADMFYATQKRELPSAYHLFTGSTFSILSRSFMEFCILGTDNLPRILLMYFANTPSSLSSYFPTVLCNSRQFSRTVINQNLLYAVYDNHNIYGPRALNSSDFGDMIQSGAAFAQKFQPDDPLLDLIDRKFLGRSPQSVIPGGWCLGEPGNGTCLTWGDANILRPGKGSRRLEKAIVGLLSNGTFRSRQCI